ncbi:patatin-like protein 2 [Tanacetum coccineum]
MKTFTQASVDLVNYRMNNVFEILDCPDNYLRIQDDKLTGDMSSLDKATKKNLEDLEQFGKDLLDKEVVEGGGISNREALRKFAEKLSEERKKRDPKDLSDLAKKKKVWSISQMLLQEAFEIERLNNIQMLVEVLSNKLFI